MINYIVLGGHTAEMIRLISTIDFVKFNSRIYLISDQDLISNHKILNLELKINSGKVNHFITTSSSLYTKRYHKNSLK